MTPTRGCNILALVCFVVDAALLLFSDSFSIARAVAVLAIGLAFWALGGVW